LSESSVRVSVYRNLTLGCLSVKAGRQPVSHADDILLENVEFRVRPAGRDKVRREGRKGVHAFVTGTVSPNQPPTDGWLPFTYDPYKHDQFVRADTSEPVFRASWAHLSVRPGERPVCRYVP
jgi:hypothetical protein